jgi:small conductance mechanosensitive channel
MVRAGKLSVLLWLCAVAPVAAQPAGQAQDEASPAERTARLQRSIEDNEKLLIERKAQLEDPEGEYSSAETEFVALDKELEAKKKELRKLEEEGQADAVATLQKELEALQQRWELARERFDLAIEERKAIQQQIATLEHKLGQDRETLSRLLAPPTTQSAASQPAASSPAQPDGEPVTTAETPAGTPQAPVPTVPPAVVQPGAEPARQPSEPPSEALVAAEKEAEVKATEAETAKRELESVTERLETVRKQIENERTLLDTTRKKAANAEEARRTLTEQLQKRSLEQAPRDELQTLWTEIAEARQRFREARTEVDQRVDQIDRLQDEFQRLQAEQITALRQEEQKRREADQAQERLTELKNPFSPRNLRAWALSHGVKVLGILIAMVVLLWLARVLEHRIVAFFVSRSGPRSAVEREDRAKTLVSAFRNAASLAIVVGGSLMILSEIGLPIAPLLGGAAVLGLAVAFGAQNLVRDYFTGFMILLENQYSINDVIKVGGVAGLVERITLRVTVLRDLEGAVHFVPNGQITTVSNLTHGWSRVVLDIGVAYKEDIDRVTQVIQDIGREVCSDPDLKPLILGDLEVLGVDALTDSAVVIKALIKTRPLQQWTVKRALMRRLKMKFDELGIEIPFPHRTIFHRREPGVPAPPGSEIAD